MKINSSRVRLMAVAGVALAPAAAFAADLTVPSATYPTIQSAVNAAVAGDTVRVQPGTYAETVTFDNKDGSAGSRITILADGALGTVVLQPTGDRAFYLKKSSFITIKGFKIAGAAMDAITLEAGNSNHNNDITIDSNEITGCGTTSNARGAIIVGRGNPNTYIVNNLIRNNVVQAMEFGFGSNVPGTNAKIVVNNTVYANGGSGVFARSEDVVHLVNNLFLGNGTAMSGFGVEVANENVAATNKILKNNFFYKNVGGDFDSAAKWLDAGDSGNRTTLGTEGTGVAGTVFATNPGGHALLEFFVSATNFRNNATSPAVNAGLSTYSVASVQYVPSVDFEGEARALAGADSADLGWDEQPPLPAVAIFWDTDRDGRSDTDEVNLYGTNRLLRDTDGDGIEDGIEIGTGTNPLSITSPVSWTDTDKDYVPNLFPNNTTLTGSDPAGVDTDGDRVRDAWEIAVQGETFGLTGNLTVASGDARILMGDIDDDGDVDANDAYTLLNMVVNSDPTLADPAIVRDADIDRDRFITRNDAYLLLYFTQGRIPYLPYR